MSDARTSLKASLKWIAIGIGGLLLAAVAVLLLFIYQADALLEQKLAELRAAGEPTSLADLEPKAIPDEDNADTYLRRAHGETEAMNGEVFAALEKLSQAEQDAVDNLQPGEKALAAMRAAIVAHPSAMPLIEQASRAPGYNPQYNYHAAAMDIAGAMLPDVQQIRNSYRVLQHQTLVQIADGRRDEALETCATALRFSRRLARRPALIEHLVALAGRSVAADSANLALRSGAISAAAHAELERELASDDLATPFRDALRAERVVQIQTSFRALLVGALPDISWTPFFKSEESDWLDMMQTAIATDLLPYDRWQSEVAAATRGYLLARLEQPSLEACHQATVRTLAKLRALRVLNALTALPETDETGEIVLGDLGLPDEATTDPFNGKPLIVKRLPEGWLIYSVGADLKDDGGDIPAGVDIGLGPLLRPEEHAEEPPVAGAEAEPSDAEPTP